MATMYRTVFTDTGKPSIEKILERANALLPFSQATGILDDGCGPAPVMSHLLNSYDIPESCTLTCSDFSEGMIKQVQKTKEEETTANPKSPWARMQTVVQDAMDLKSIPDGSQSHVTAGFMFFMTSDPQKALSEAKRVLKDGGVLSCSAWVRLV
jgi:ubiquinone/menaquinone biosynthesis C-methylase UbiE